MYMAHAMLQAEHAFAAGEVPIGAVLVRDGAIVSAAHNRVESSHDASAHAEMLCMRSAGADANAWRLNASTLYVTVEPCAMCHAALHAFRVDRLVYGAPNTRMGAIESDMRAIAAVPHPYHQVSARLAACASPHSVARSLAVSRALYVCALRWCRCASRVVCVLTRRQCSCGAFFSGDATSLVMRDRQSRQAQTRIVCVCDRKKDGEKNVVPRHRKIKMSMLVRLGGMGAVFGGACYAERVLLAPVLPALFAPSPLLGGLVSKLYGAVIGVNVVGSSCMMLWLSFIPGTARKRFMEKAKKAGDKDAEDRFGLPKLYAEGFSEEAKEFNCHQRAHQQALETYANFVICSVIGGIRQPLLTLLAGCLYIIARVKWAKGYTTGDPINRYKASGGWGHHVWTSLLTTMVCALSTGLGVSGIA